MGLGQSPPTTSGIVVLSGSNNFGLSGDFPVFASIDIKYHIEDQIHAPPMDLVSSKDATDSIAVPVLKFVDLHVDEPNVLLDLITTTSADALIDVPVLAFDLSAEDNSVQTYLHFVGGGDNVKITSTPVTVSGIVVLDLFPGAGLSDIPIPPYVPPSYLNQRIFPVTFSGAGERVFPEENRRIYPVLPQFSIITPGG